MYVLTFLSKWYGKEIFDLNEDEAENIQEHVENGTIVMLCDDLEYAADMLKISQEDIIMK